MAMKMNFTLVMIITIIFSSSLHSGELTFGWNKINENGAIYDMEFMPDNNSFVFVDYKSLQVRNTETGELVNNYPIPELFAAHDIEFTPDSTRMILAYGDKLELRNVSDMSIIKEYKIPEGTDTAGYDIYESIIRLHEIVVDPIRPYVYAIRKRSGTLNGNIYFDIRKVAIINYESMEEVGVMPNSNGDNLWLQRIAISKDGKYLAVNNGGASYLRVWDLGTRQEIRSYKLCDYIPGSGDDGQPSCTKFSELNSDIIYIVGDFPKSRNGARIYGLITYSIDENRIIDSTFGFLTNSAGLGDFIYCDNEERIIKSDGKNILIINIKKKLIEQKINQDTISSGKRYWSIKLLYSSIKNTLVGFNKEKFSYAIYNNSTGIEDPLIYDTVIYPNPNTGFVTLQTSCQNPVQTYEVLDINGYVVIPATGITVQAVITTIDISTLPVGTYFLRYFCGTTLITYKVIKEG